MAAPCIAIDPPHTATPDANVSCVNCHNPGISLTQPGIDNTPLNIVCRNCHKAGGSATHQETHSSRTTFDEIDRGYWGGQWTNECRTCHNPHTQEQARGYAGAYPSGSWLYTGTIASSTASTITVSGTPWTQDQWAGYVLHPRAGSNYYYRILGNTGNTITVDGSMYSFVRQPGGTFAISYGKLVRKDLNTGRKIINSSGVVFDPNTFRTVKFLNATGPYSAAETGQDASAASQAVCVVCHTQTGHMNIGVAKYGNSFEKFNTYNHYYSDTQTCWGANCHNSSAEGFGASCLECHGYPPTKQESLINDGAPAKGATGRTSAGAHDLHYKQKVYACSTCHDGGAPGADHNDEANPRLQIGFYVFGSKGGSYTAPAFPNAEYALASGNAETTVSIGAGMTCSSIYCHSSVQADGGSGAPAYATPAWDGSVACGDCHKADGLQGNASIMDTGSHPAHLDAGVSCDDCHNGYTHVNNNVEVTASFTYSSAGPPRNGYGTCATGGCHMPIQWGNGACLDCHNTSQGSRAAITPQFSANSHHIQGGSLTSAQCYKCHWEAKSDGRIDPAYHGGSGSPGAPVDLVVYGASGSRPTDPSGGNRVTYTANGSRAEIAKINTHCLGCHSDGNNGIDIFGDGKSPNYYAWDTPTKTSIDSRYSQTTTTVWGKYSGSGVSPKNTQTKAYSAHGKATSNQGGWDLNETWTNTRNGSVNVACFDCHNSHGSTASGTTTSYTSATANGGILKDTQNGRGGYSATYKPASGGSAGNKNAYNTGAGLCFDCHLASSAGTSLPSGYTSPWGYSGTFGATQSIMGYFDTPYFGPGTSGPMQRFSTYKSSLSHKGGHFGASSGLANAASYGINGLCTPCHDPHGVSTTLGANMQYAVPLLKGTWITSPYLEDRAPANNVVGTVRTEGVGYHRTPDITQPDSQFAGLCLKCHPKNKLTDGSNGGAWKSIDRIHESVNGWGAGNHRYSCSKCHAPHNSRLPRLMVTNCMDKRHKGRVVANASPALSATGYGDSGYCYSGPFCPGYDPSEPGWGTGKGNFPGVYQEAPGGDVGTTPIAICHAGQNGSWDDQSWNIKTLWAAPALASPTATAIASTTATLGANVTSDGGLAITARGTVWGTSPNPTGNALAEGGTTTGVFSHARTGLPAGAKIYYRGYATNGFGTGYSLDGSFYTEPSTQASGVNFTSVTSNGMRVNWTRGDGDGVIVLMKQGSAVSSSPADGTYTDYIASPIFGSGTQIGSGNYVIYKGTGTSVNVDGLSPNTAYYVAVYEFKGTVNTSGADQGTNYKSSPATGNQATNLASPTLVAEPDAVCASSCAVTLEWGAVTVLDGDPVQYYVEVDTTTGFNSGNLKNSGWISGTSWNTPSLATNTLWYWRVRARDAVHTSNVSNWSSVDGFDLWDGTVPPLPQLSWPPNGYYGQVGYPAGENLLQWNAAAGATEYYCEYWGASSGNSGWTTATSFDPGDLPDNEYYYWRVKARNASGESGWSETWWWYDEWDGGGSCPMLYVWDGAKFDFKADLYGPGKLATKSKDGYLRPYPHDYYILDAAPTPKDGYYEMRMVEERFEVNYFDELKLYYLDVPSNRDVYAEKPTFDSVFGTLEQALHTTDKNLPNPVSVVHVNTGEDVSAKLASSDGDYLILSNDRNLDFEYHTIEMDLGDLSSAPQIKLLIDGMTAFPDSPEGVARSEQFGPRTKLEVLDADGRWVKVDSAKAILPKLPEFRRPFVLDISNIFLTNVYKVRLTFLFKTYVDSIRFDTTPDEPIALVEIPLASADLRSYGLSEEVTVFGDLTEYVYNMDSPNHRHDYFPGSYTRFGDVAPLLSATDDKFVIFGSGDEVALKFNPAGSAPAVGFRRVFLFYTNGYYKDGKVDVAHRVEPLPFAAMSNFPYDEAVERYPDDEEHNLYRQEYNTRLVDVPEK